MSVYLDPSALGAVAGVITRRMEQGNIPGACAAVWLKGQKVYETYLGAAKHDGRPIREDTLFHLASMTKPITAVAVMQQVQAGRLALTDPVSRYIPELANLRVADKNQEGEVVGSHPSPREITLLDCLTHSSGMACGSTTNLDFPNVRMRAGECLSDFVPRYAAIRLDFDPGTAQCYSPLAAPDVAACIVEKVSGTEFSEYLRLQILEPLGMVDTTFAPTPEQRARLIEAFKQEGDKCVPSSICDSGFYPDMPSMVGGGGGLFSTLRDYGRFACMLSAGGELDGVRILSEESIAEIAKPRLSTDLPGIGKLFNWGLLVRTLPAQSALYQPLPAGSWGWSGAFGTHFFIDPTLKACGVFMANTTTSKGAGACTAKDFERAYVSAIREK